MGSTRHVEGNGEGNGDLERGGRWNEAPWGMGGKIDSVGELGKSPVEPPLNMARRSVECADK